jgi:hypothetical protein
MTQGHLVTQFRIHSEFTNNPIIPFDRSLGPPFVSGYLWPTLLSLSPYSALWILHSEFHSRFLSHLEFLRSTCRLLVTASVVPSSPILITLMKEALSSSETSLPHGVTSQKTPFFTERHVFSVLGLWWCTVKDFFRFSLTSISNSRSL